VSGAAAAAAAAVAAAASGGSSSGGGNSNSSGSGSGSGSGSLSRMVKIDLHNSQKGTRTHRLCKAHFNYVVVQTNPRG
jgi:hypothetical protein